MADAPDIYGEEDVADLLGCSLYTVHEKARRCELPALKFGEGGWIFPRQALVAHLNQMALDRMNAGQPVRARMSRGSTAEGDGDFTADGMRQLLRQATGEVLPSQGGVPQNH